MYILSDADGVMLNWIGAFDEYMQKQGWVKAANADSSYNIAKRFENLSGNRARKFVEEFNSSEALEYLEPLKDAVEYVEKLHNLGYKFIIVSAFSTCEQARGRRMRNLKNIFGDAIHDVYGVEIGASKRYILDTNWGNSGMYWLEDHFGHAEAGYEVGLKPILVSNSTNTRFHTDLFPRVNSNTPWREIYDIIASNS